MEVITDNETSTAVVDVTLIHKKVLHSYAKIIVFLVVIAVLGVVGNSTTVAFYIKQSKQPFNRLVLYLACVDLAVNFMTFVAAVETYMNILLTSSAACKIIWFGYFWTVYTSIILLSIIGHDRFRKICRPFKPQLNLKVVNLCLAITIILTGIVSSRTIFTQEIETLKVNRDLSRDSFFSKVDPENVYQNLDSCTLTNINKTWTRSIRDKDVLNTSTSFTQETRFCTSTVDKNNTNTGEDTRALYQNGTNSSSNHSDYLEVEFCTNTKNPKYLPVVMAFHIIDMVCVSLILINLVFSYVCVIRSLIIHRNSMKYLKKPNKAKVDTGNTEAVTDQETSVLNKNSQQYTLRRKLHKEKSIQLVAIRLLQKFSQSEKTEEINHDTKKQGLGEKESPKLVTVIRQERNRVAEGKCMTHKGLINTKCSDLESDAEIFTQENITDHAKMQVLNNEDLSRNCNDLNSVTEKSITKETEGNMEPEVNELRNTESAVKLNIYQTKQNKQKSKGQFKQSEIQITIAMLVISAGFLVSFIPYFIENIRVRYLSPVNEALDADSYLQIRFALLNSVINPYIYYIFSTQYRQYLNSKICRLCTNT